MPFRKRGFFYSHWERGGEEWQRARVTALECPRIGRMEDGLSVFSRDLMMKALDPRVLPLVVPEIGNW